MANKSIFRWYQVWYVQRVPTIVTCGLVYADEAGEFSTSDGRGYFLSGSYLTASRFRARMQKKNPNVHYYLVNPK